VKLFCLDAILTRLSVDTQNVIQSSYKLDRAGGFLLFDVKATGPKKPK